MAIALKLSKSFGDVFSSYAERYKSNYIFFEGKLKQRYKIVTNGQLIRFINGGRRYMDYKLERDGTHFKGWVRYYPYKPLKTMCSGKGRKLSKATIDEIRDLYKQGYSKAEIAAMTGVSRSSVTNITNNKGRYSLGDK
ncbi:helix-turn-helix domain-containing protein [Anaerococcus nagyae]|uniref:helix-turn-helix domain-containing protein n=1 Tax=Anaerococcus nagyae TaxID=1755241 RepID=UPI00324A8383